MRAPSRHRSSERATSRTSRSSRLAAFAVGVACFVGARPAFAQETGTLALSIVDADSGEPLFARVYLRSADGTNAVRGIDPFNAGGPFYLAKSSLEVEVVAGTVNVEVQRGLEYDATLATFEVGAGLTVRETLSLRRWTHPSEQGWYSGDTHVHYPADLACDHTLAEDLNVGTSIAAWITGADQAQEAPRLERVRVLDATHVCSLNDQENERVPIVRYGAPVYLVYLASPIHFDAPTAAWPLNFEYQRRARAQGGVAVAHSSSFDDVAVSVALGELDAVELACNFFGYDYALARTARYGNADDLAEFGDTVEGTLRMVQEKYYRLLDCGFRLPLSGGSAAGVKSSPVGHNRVYVKLDGAFSAQAFWDGFRAGRSFVTNGPMLYLEVEGLGPGSVVRVPASNVLAPAPQSRRIARVPHPPVARLASGAREVASIGREEAALIYGKPRPALPPSPSPASDGMVEVSVRAEWNRELAPLELVSNGVVVRTLEPEPDGHQVVWKGRVRPERSGWIVARVRGTDPNLIRFAHTSPVYLEVPGKPRARARAAAYWAKWIGARIDKLATDDGFADDTQRADVRRTFEAALAVFQSMHD
ncbi:MAG: hypothetical protein K8S98_04755 [Planctomycetes bacterium]|nr:hypothetical protein [Planctomycetota bacterium]